MTTGKMHVDEVDTSVDLVARLLAGQFPQWASLPLVPVPSAGTDNALYRLGADMVVRLPRIDWAAGQAEKEQRWLPRLAPHLPLAIPVPLAQGEPGRGLSLAVVRLPLARRRERDPRAPALSGPGGGRAGGVHLRPAADRSRRRPAVRGA